MVRRRIKATFRVNSLHKNDENLIQITQCPRLAAIYFAEFFRLFEHYRARVAFERRQAGDDTTFKLTPDNTWSRKYFVPDSSDARSRVARADAKN
jgi:hypothetical protein